MERVFGTDDLVGAVLVQLAPLARDLDGRLVGLRAAIGEEDALHARGFQQQLGQLELGQGVVEVGGVQEGVRLVRNGRRHGGVGVAEYVDGDPRHEVEVGPARVIPDARAASPHQRQRLTPEGVHVGACLARLDRRQLRDPCGERRVVVAGDRRPVPGIPSSIQNDRARHRVRQ